MLIFLLNEASNPVLVPTGSEHRASVMAIQAHGTTQR